MTKTLHVTYYNRMPRRADTCLALRFPSRIFSPAFSSVKKAFDHLKADNYIIIAAWFLSLASDIIWTVLVGDLHIALAELADASSDDLYALIALLQKYAQALHGKLTSSYFIWTL